MDLYFFVLLAWWRPLGVMHIALFVGPLVAGCLQACRQEQGQPGHYANLCTNLDEMCHKLIRHLSLVSMQCSDSHVNYGVLQQIHKVRVPSLEYSLDFSAKP